MARQHRNHYNEDFKKRAVLQHLENHGTLAGSASQLGITAGMLSKWVERYEGEAKDKPVQAMNYDWEIKQLKKEMKTLKDIVTRIFLKKYTAEEIAEKVLDEPEKVLTID